MTAVALPAVRGTLGCGAADLVAAYAVVALTASADVVDADAIPDRQSDRAWADYHDLTGRLVPGDDALIHLRRVALDVLAVDGPNVRAANGRGAHRQQDLSGSGLGVR